MPIEWTIQLQEDIEALDTIPDALALAVHLQIPMKDWKAMLQRHTESFTEASAIRVLFNTRSIEQIVPTDILCQIESFIHCKTLRYVSKAFAAAYKQSENLMLKHQKIALKIHVSRFRPKIKNTGKVWEVIKEPMVVEEDPMEVKYEPPDVGVCPSEYTSTDLAYCINFAKTGDTIYLESGVHIMLGICATIDGKEIRVIGRGDHVVVETQGDGWVITNKAKVLFENIEFRWSKHAADNSAAIIVQNASKVWIRRCVLMGIPNPGYLINLKNEGNMLEMLDTTLSSSHGIKAMGRDQTVKAVRCTFLLEGMLVKSDGRLILIGNDIHKGYMGGGDQKDWSLICNRVDPRCWCPFIETWNNITFKVNEEDEAQF